MRTFAEYVEKRDEENPLNEVFPLLAAAAPYALGAAGSYLGGQAIGSALDASGVTGVAKNVGSAVGQGANYLGKGVYNMGKGLYNAAFGSGKQAAQQGQQGQQGQQAAQQQAQQAAQQQAQYGQAIARNHRQFQTTFANYSNVLKNNPIYANNRQVNDLVDGINDDLQELGNVIRQSAQQGYQQQSGQAGAADYRRLQQYPYQAQPQQRNAYNQA
jgi:hypothetical protein